MDSLLLRLDENHKRRQISGSIKKLTIVGSEINSLHILSKFIHQVIPDPQSICCHGSRQGVEQSLMSLFMRTFAFGTDISPSVLAFPSSYVHDFHQKLPSKVSVIYSNSWDHTTDPDNLFKTWLSDLLLPGLLILQYGESGHSLSGVSALDPFGSSIESLFSRIYKSMEDLQMSGTVAIVEEDHQSGTDQETLKYVVAHLSNIPNSSECLKLKFNHSKALCGKDISQNQYYSVHDSSRQFNIANTIAFIRHSQLVIAGCLSQPDEITNQYINNLRALLSASQPNYNYATYQNANSTPSYRGDVLELLP